MWTILSETRRKCWRSWAFGAAALFLLAIAQTVFGKFDGIVPLAWGWALLTGLTGFAVLTVSTVTNRTPAKLIPENVHKTLVITTRGYLVLVAVTLLAEPFAVRGKLSTQEYLVRSMFWLGPALLVLMGIYWLFFFKKEPVFLPNPKIILETAANARTRATKKGNGLQQQFFGMVADGNLAPAMESISKHLIDSGSPEANSMILLRSQLAETNKSRDLGTADPAESQRSLNRITLAVLDVIETV